MLLCHKPSELIQRFPRGIAADLTITQEEREAYFLLKGRPNKTCTKPRTALRSDKIYNWTWPNLQKLIAGQR